MINSTAWVWVTSLVRTCGHHPPQVERGDAVGHLEDVGHVVADEDDAEALLGEAPHQVEHLAGLRDAQRRGRLVEHHDLGVPEHGLGDRDGLALTTGERGDRHPHRRHRADRQRRQGAPRRLLHVGLVEQPGRCPARGRGTCSGRCPGCRRARGPGRRPRCRACWRRSGRGSPPARRRTAPRRVDRVDARHALDQRRLARAVVAHERGDLTGPHREVDPVQHLHRAEVLVHPA